MPGKRRSIWITEANMVRLKDLVDVLRMDNENMVINVIIEDYSKYLKNKGIIDIFNDLKKELKNDKI